MKRLFLAFFAVAMFGAQVPVLSAPATPAAPETLDPMKVAAARDLLEAMRFKFALAADMKAAASGAEDMLHKIVARKVQDNAQLDAAARTKATAALQKMMPEAVEALEGVFTDPQTSEDISKETARIYARTFSVEELVQIATFYRTPTGQKLLGMSTRIHNESLAYGRQYILRRIDTLVEEMMKNAAPEQPPRKDAK
ncbi:DUF2059 domain-containing protein [Massilia sp. PAMC28688]|uniref:DUF2059 domain-containing protein n=1 Tax=Massilia sp. PAMC28688 TaxID=2861283 RepID=UPI001C62E507|nr:DUF2059 domain-containing protein [Massilia sp. PAMC28688]QYF94071.1 DUF2059 domain-containing protein [Massilia sp. PAMC28688]